MPLSQPCKIQIATTSRFGLVTDRHYALAQVPGICGCRGD